MESRRRRRPDSQSFAMKAVLLVGGFSTQMRPITMSLPLPLIEFCNVSLLEHQLRALKDAGVSEVLICVHERVVPTTFDDYVKRCEVELGLKIGCAKEETALGTAGPLKAAEAMITSESDPDTPFIVVNSDVLCTYPLRDLLHLHKSTRARAQFSPRAARTRAAHRATAYALSTSARAASAISWTSRRRTCPT